MSARAMKFLDGFIYICTDCQGEGRVMGTFQGAERGRVEHALPGGCPARRVESAAWNDLVNTRFWIKRSERNGNRQVIGRK